MHFLEWLINFRPRIHSAGFLQVEPPRDIDDHRVWRLTDAYGAIALEPIWAPSPARALAFAVTAMPCEHDLVVHLVEPGTERETFNDGLLKLCYLRLIAREGRPSLLDEVQIDPDMASTMLLVYDSLAVERAMKLLALPIDQMKRVSAELIDRLRIASAHASAALA